jgi:hypothetical protein
MPAFLSFLFRLIFVVAGLVFAGSLAFAFVLMLAAWSLRSVWARLTGRPVVPFIMRIDPRGGFERMYPRAPRPDFSAKTGAVRPTREAADVTDVEPRSPS